MKNRFGVLFSALSFGLVLIACGGGGPVTSDKRASGRVLDIATGGPFSRAATVQSSVAIANTVIADGSFNITVAGGTTSLSVNAPAASSYPTFQFLFPALNLAQNEVGDLWVGPEKVRVTGTLRNAANGNPIASAPVQFGGQHTVSGADGVFSLNNVAYSSSNTASFLGLVGRVNATGFFANEFTSGGNTATAGVVNVGELLLTPLDSETPPGLPYTIWGNISPRANALNTVVTLKDSGNAVVRRFNVGSDARYQFWVPPGSYTVEFQNGSLSAPSQNVTLSTTTDVVQANATLN
jgi:hypothetical protein